MDLLTQDLLRKYKINPRDDLIRNKLFVNLLRQQNSPEEEPLIAVPYRHFIRKIKRGGRMSSIKNLTLKEALKTRNLEDYSEIFNSYQGISYGVAFFLPYKKGMSLKDVEKEIPSYSGLDINGIAIITPQLQEILESCKYQTGRDTDSDAQNNTLVGLAVAQAVELIEFKEPIIEWFD